MMFLILIAGCVGGQGPKQPGTPEAKATRAPEYEFLLDRNYWMKQFGPEGQAKDLPKESQWMMDVVNTATGANNWEQVSLGSEKTDTAVTVSSTSKYKSTGAEDDSLSALLSKVDPVKPKVLSGFKADGLLGTLALGNPRVATDAVAQWFFDSKSLTDALKAQPQGEQILQSFVFIKQGLKGMYMQAKEKTEPLVGEEFVFALYVNKDFIGWEKADEAETFIQGSPVRFVIAMSAAKPGLAQAFSESLADIGPTIASFGAMMGANVGADTLEQVKAMFTAKTMKADGYDILYLDFDGFQFGWAENDGAMFMSDVETLKNLKNYFDPAQAPKNLPATYNSYCSVDIDKCLKSFGDGWKDFLDKWVEEVKKDNNEEMTKLAEGLVNTLKTGDNFGSIESIMINGKNGVETKLKLNAGAGPLVLQMTKFMETAMQSLESELKESQEPKGSEEKEGSEGPEGSEV